MSATALTCRCRGPGGKIIPVKKGIRILGLIGITGVGCKGAGSRESGLDICIFPFIERKMCPCVHNTFLARIYHDVDGRGRVPENSISIWGI